MFHGAFGRCAEIAQNECPRHPGATAEDVLSACLQLMFEEGPGGGHYDNMTDRKLTTAFCGFAVDSTGRIWSVQDFHDN